MGRRQSNYWCLGLVIAGFTSYLVGIALYGSSLLILMGLLIAILGMSAWAVSGLGNTSKAKWTQLDSPLEADLSKHLPDPLLPGHAKSPGAESQSDLPDPEREHQHLSSTVA